MRWMMKSAALALAAFPLLMAGCAPDRPENVPHDALEVTEGSRDLSYRAPSDGTIYIYDVDHDRIVYSGKVERGDLVSLDTKRDRITIDGDTVFEKGLRTGNQHRFFFDPEGDRRVIVKERTVIEHDRR